MWYFGTSTGESNRIVTTFGWVLIGIAFLMLIMVANNSWSFVWSKILGGTTAPTPAPPISQQSRTGGQDTQSGNIVTPAPPISQQSRTGGQDTQSGNIITPPTQLVPTVNGVVQSSTGNQATA